MKIASISCLLLVLALGAESGPARAAETNKAPLVGSLRELDRFIFEGNNSFSGTNLWLGLNSTYDFPAQSHPLAPRDAFLSAIESQLRLGYIHCGFPDARITACYDSKADRVVVRIQEGTRYQCGPVEVIGARKIPTQSIVETLTVTNACTEVLMQSFQFLDNAPANRTEAAETNSTKIWVAGQPAHFDDISLRYLSGKVTNALAKHGFFLSRFTLNVVTNPATQTATLQVKILDEGPPAIIDRINVVGNQKNSRKVMLNYLDLKPGMAFTSDLAATINNRLYHSARFLTNSVQTNPPDVSGRVKLTVAVVENNEGPPLTGKFEPVEQAILKTRDWLAKLDDSGEEAVLSASGYSDGTCSVQCILAPHRGLLVLENMMAGGTNRFRRALLLSPSRIALYASEQQQKYVAHLSSSQFTSYITMETEAPDADGHCMNFEAGAGMQSLGDATNAPPYALSMSLAPAAFLRLTPGKHFTRRFDGDQLIISNADTVLKLDTRTGRIIGLTFNAPEPSHLHTSLHFEPNAFGSALAGVERDGAGFANVYRTNSPFGSALVFFGNELLQFPEVDVWLRARLPAQTYAQLPALLHRLGAEDFLAPWESFIHQHAEPDDPDEKFEIPEEPRPVMGGTFGAEITAAAQFVLACGDLILPPRSWPWTISRDIAFLFHGQPNFLEPDLTEICRSDDLGPIGCLAIARIQNSLKSPLAKVTAARGLQRLSAEAFRSDCRLFLDEHYATGQFAARLAATLGELNEPELEAVVASMPDGGADFVRDCAGRVRMAPKGQALIDTLAPALDAYWEKEGKQKVADELKKLANN
jgi:hypothetical protein